MTKILVAEDERDIRDLVVETLFDQGYDVLESKDGRETFEIARSEIPDLILLDVMMPVMDGFEVLSKLKQSSITDAIPVVMLTAMWASDGEQNAMRLGVRHYISKPFDPETLQATVRVALREAKTMADGRDGSTRV
jgi:DNA-binding response OmpR family regulator